MTDFASLLVPDRGQKARPIHLVDKESFAGWSRSARPRTAPCSRPTGSTTSRRTLSPSFPAAATSRSVSAVKDAAALSPWCLAALAEKLPEGTYRLAEGEPGKAALGWLLAQHRFDAYRSKKDDAERGPRMLVSGEAAQIEETVRLAEATALVRDLVNTPAADMGPAELEAARRDLAKRSGAQLARHQRRRARRGLSADRRRRRRRDARARAAPDRARMGQARRSARRDRRQGRVLRHRRARHQDRRRHAAS